MQKNLGNVDLIVNFTVWKREYFELKKTQENERSN